MSENPFEASNRTKKAASKPSFKGNFQQWVRREYLEGDTAMARYFFAAVAYDESRGGA
jgi:hypothetical protein